MLNTRLYSIYVLYTPSYILGICLWLFIKNPKLNKSKTKLLIFLSQTLSPHFFQLGTWQGYLASSSDQKRRSRFSLTPVPTRPNRPNHRQLPSALRSTYSLLFCQPSSCLASLDSPKNTRTRSCSWLSLGPGT